MRLNGLKVALLAAAIVVPSQPASANAVRVDFAGFVDSIFADGIADPNAFLDESIHVGTRFSGYFTLDVDAAPCCVGPTTAIYGFERPDWTMHTQLGDLVFDTIDKHTVQLLFGDGIDPSAVVIQGNRVRVGLGSFSADDPISSTELSLVPWTLSAYATGRFTWDATSPPLTTLRVLGTLDTLTSSAVPEPEEGLLAGLAAAAMILGSVGSGYRRART